MKCEICNYETESHQSFNSHIVHRHHINSKEYYDLYLKKENDGICLTCGNTTKFNDLWKGYRQYCCKGCISKDLNIQAKKRSTMQKHYGVDYPIQSPTIREKTYKTNMERFGAENVFASEHIKQSICATLQEKYGVDNIMRSETHKDKMFVTRSKRLQLEGKSSSLEEYLETALIEKGISFVREHKDSRYPFHCDFYLPITDTYVEIHGHWTHGKHFYNAESISDINILEKWKSKDSDYYKAAIYTWTILDPLKLLTAQQNKLNYVVLRTKEEISTFINSL